MKTAFLPLQIICCINRCFKKSLLIFTLHLAFASLLTVAQNFTLPGKGILTFHFSGTVWSKFKFCTSFSDSNCWLGQS